MTVSGFGPKDARIVIVGEAPGADEVTHGRPFVGKSGQLLRDFLMSAGIDPTSCYMTNLCQERPPGNQLKQWFKDGVPSNIAVLEGLLKLEEDLAEIRPNLILGVGSYPLAMLTGKAKWNAKEKTYTGIQNWRGSLLPCILPSVEGSKVLCTFHPAYIIREGYEDHGTWMLDLQRAKYQATFPELIYPQKNLIIDPRGEARVEAHLRLLADMRKTLTFDIEYIGSKLLCVGMTVNSDEAYVIDIKDPGDVSFVREILCSGIPLCAQNSMFDTSILEWWYNIPCMQYIKHDTMLAQHAANIEMPKSLDYLCSIYTDQPYYKDMIDWREVRAGKQPISDVLHYNAIDTWVTHSVMEQQIADDLQNKKVRETFEFEMSLLSPLWEVSKRGVLIDRVALQELKLQLSLEIEELECDLFPLAGGPINVKSNPQVASFLFDKLGCPVGGLTPGGQRKADDVTLAAVDPKCSNDLQRLAIRLVRDLRERRDLISKFCEIELEQDGRMRGHYNPGGTNTGRLASKQFYPTGKGANQQNIPRDKRVRSVFIPDMGKRFGYADLERAESLVVAHMSGDRRMLENHAPGVVAHKRVGSFLFGVSEEEIDKESPIYYLSKRTAHAGNYMLGPKKFMLMVNADTSKTGISITFGESKRLLTGYTEYYSNLPVWWAEVDAEVRKTRMLYNLLGRPRQFFGHYDSILPQAVAFRPQSTVGDTLNVALLNVEGVICPYAERNCNVEMIRDLSSDLKKYGYETLLQVHDAIGFQYQEGFDKEVCSAMRQLMSVPLLSPKFDDMFSIPVEIAIGPNWGHVEIWKEAA